MFGASSRPGAQTGIDASTGLNAPMHFGPQPGSSIHNPPGAPTGFNAPMQFGSRPGTNILEASGASTGLNAPLEMGPRPDGPRPGPGIPKPAGVARNDLLSSDDEEILI
jgi:hypothetical protein